jgi:Flp pilus assembly protein TadG
VTAEVAAVLPVLVVIVVTGMAAIGVIGAELRCVDAARAGARAAARGEPAAVVRQVAAAVAPPGARVSVAYREDQVVVAVSAEVRPLTRLLTAIRVRAGAVGQLEPGVIDAGGGR